MNPAALANKKTLAIPLVAILAVVLAGCHSGPSDNEDKAAEPPTITMAVSGVRVAIKPMHSELRLLGETVARRHISLRAPAAGRVVGLNIQTGDRVRRGEIVAHLFSREVEAAENGLAVARQILQAHRSHSQPARPPKSDRLHMNPERPCDLRIVLSIGGCDDHPSPQRDLLGHRDIARSLQRRQVRQSSPSAPKTASRTLSCTLREPGFRANTPRRCASRIVNTISGRDGMEKAEN